MAPRPNNKGPFQNILKRAFKLRDKDSNLSFQGQNLACCRCTIPE